MPPIHRGGCGSVRDVQDAADILDVLFHRLFRTTKNAADLPVCLACGHPLPDFALAASKRFRTVFVLERFGHDGGVTYKYGFFGAKFAKNSGPRRFLLATPSVSPRKTQRRPYTATFVTGSLQSLWPVLPPRPQSCIT